VSSKKTIKDLKINATLGINVGHVVDSKTYRCYMPSSNDFVTKEVMFSQEIATNVIEEQKMPGEMDYNITKTIANLDFL
jgi:hypothetical protein